jgi:hypothetical protein
VVTVAWNVAQGLGWKNDLDAVYPAVLASLASLVIVSLMTPPPAEEKWRPFFE